MENNSVRKETDDACDHKYEVEEEAVQVNEAQPDYSYKEAADLDDYLSKYYNNKILKFDKHTMYELPRPLIVACHHYNERYWQIDYITECIEALRVKYEGQLHFAVADFTDEPRISKSKYTVWGPGVIIINENPWIYAITEDKKVWRFGSHFETKQLDKFCEKISKKDFQDLWQMKEDL